MPRFLIAAALALAGLLATCADSKAAGFGPGGFSFGFGVTFNVHWSAAGGGGGGGCGHGCYMPPCNYPPPSMYGGAAHAGQHPWAYQGPFGQAYSGAAYSGYGGYGGGGY